MKRQITLLLAGAVASSCMSVTGYAANFKDINDVPWDGAKTVINSVADLGLLNGYEDNTFRARNNVTYIEAMHMVYTLLEKTGTAKPMDAAEHFKYIAVMEAYKIPTWAQRSVAYGLNNSIVSSADLGKFMTGATSNYANREDVAKIFGQALAVRYDIDRDSKKAAEFNDAWRISEESIALVDLLARLGIVNGDENNNFQPKNNINRAEMAVMLNKAYEVLNSGMANTGTISTYEYDGNTYKMTIKSETGDAYSFYARPESTKVFVGDTKEEMPLSRLNAGDKISFTYNGGSLEEIRVIDGSNTQAKYDITGYITSLKNGLLTIENENTGETDKYDLDSDCNYYLEGKSVRRSELETELKENSAKYAYVGLNTNVNIEKGKDSNGSTSRVEKTYITEAYVTFTDEYSRIGQVVDLTSSEIRFKAVGGSSENRIEFASDCVFMTGDKTISNANAKTMADSGTVYVKVTIGKNAKASGILLSEEPFETTAKKDETIYKVSALSDTKLVLESGGNKVTYNFGSTNPVSNIGFYRWDEDDETWTGTNLSSVQNLFDVSDNKGTSLYCRVEFNSGGKLTKVYVSTKKGAWSEGENPDAYTDRKGNIESLSANKLKFVSVATTYTMLPQYNVKISDDKDADVITGTDPNGSGSRVKNPLSITSAKTSSLNVFQKMAGDKDLTLYAEVKSNSKGEVQQIDARLTAAKVSLVSYEKEDKLMVVETSSGNQYNLKSVSRPGLNSDDYTLDDLATSGYVGSKLELEFNSEGLINKVIVVDSNYDKGTKRVKGIATDAAGGLRIEGTSGTFNWLSRGSTDVKNFSMNSTSLDRVIELIDDDDITAYVEATLSEKDAVERIWVYVRDAKGEFQEYDKSGDTVRIRTAAGTLFTFNTIPSPSIDIDGIAKDKVNDKAVGEDVKLTFNNEGEVTAINSK